MNGRVSRLLFTLVAAVVGGTCAVWLFYPGMMSPDSLDTYSQALSGQLSGYIHPPLMALVWRGILLLIPGPQGLLVFHQLMFWAGLSLIVLACALPTATGASLLLMIGFFPPVFMLLGVLWRDVSLGCALTLATGLILFGKRRRQPLIATLAAVPLFYAAGVRFNAVPAVLPLAAWMVSVVWRSLSRQTLAAAAVVVTMAILGANSVIVRMLTADPSRLATIPMQMSMAHDLAGIAVRVNEQTFPDYIAKGSPPFRLDTIRGLYDPADVNPLVWTPPWRERMITYDPEQFHVLAVMWGRALMQYPRAYGGHRMAVLESLFGISRIQYPFHEGIDPNDLGLRFETTPLYRRVTALAHATEGLFFRGVLYLIAALWLAVDGLRKRLWDSTVIAVSGIGYVVPYSVVSAGSDFRFLWWLLVATLLSALVRLDEPRRSAAPN